MMVGTEIQQAVPCERVQPVDGLSVYLVVTPTVFRSYEHCRPGVCGSVLWGDKTSVDRVMWLWCGPVHFYYPISHWCFHLLLYFFVMRRRTLIDLHHLLSYITIYHI